MLTVKQVSERLGVSAQLVYSLASSGKLRCYRVGTGRGVLRFTEEHVAAYLNGTERTPEPPTRPPRLRHLKL